MTSALLVEVPFRFFKNTTTTKTKSNVPAPAEMAMKLYDEVFIVVALSVKSAPMNIIYIQLIEFFHPFVVLIIVSDYLLDLGPVASNNGLKNGFKV